MTSNPFLARFDQAPALVNPHQQMQFDASIERASTFMTRLDDRLSSEPVEVAKDLAHNDDGFWPSADSWMARYRPYVVVNGTLHIPVKGVLLHDFGYNLGDWATGYDYITRAIQRGLADGNVKRIALVVNSPGGEVAGCFECADKIFAARSQKPIHGFAHEHGYSAAYAIISAASVIHVSRTGGVGSIGVVTSHMDVSKRMEQLGVKITFIFAGKHKVDGNAYEALSAEVKQRIQTRIDELYGVFVSTVARHRNLDEAAVRETEAKTFTASEALSNGLADKVGPFDEALASFEAELSTETENETMSTQDSSATDQAAAAALDAARNEGMTAGRTEGAANERARISAILGSDEAKTRPVAAMNVAMKTNMAVEDAAAFLANLNEESAAATESTENAGAGAGDNRFNTAMQNGNPDLNGNGGAGGEGAEQQSGASSLIAARQKATGFGPKSNVK